jgi:hypothetical protein
MHLSSLDPTGTARDRGDELDAVAVLHRRRQALQEADVLVVQEHVHEAVELALVVEQAPAQLLVARGELLQHLPHRAAGELHARGAVHVPAQGRGDPDADFLGHRSS